MKKYLLAGAIIGLALGALQLMVPYVVLEPCVTTSDNPRATCDSSNSSTFYRGWPLASKGDEDEIGVSYRYDQPPITWQSFANIAIIMPGTIAITSGIALMLGWARTARSGRLVLLVSLAVGLVLSVGQVLYLRHETRQLPIFDMSQVMPCDQKVAGCGYCPEAQKVGHYCNPGTFEQAVRGWPLPYFTYDKFSQYDVTPKPFINAAIVTAGVVIAGLLGLGAVGLMRRKK